jgi:hypothetical protein
MNGILSIDPDPEKLTEISDLVTAGGNREIGDQQLEAGSSKLGIVSWG